MIITLSGLTGSGKTTVGKILAKRLGYGFFSGGDFRGEMATKMGITIDELNEIAKKDIWTDKKVDDKVKRLGETEDNLVIDSWTAFHFIPQAFKVFLEIDMREGAERVFREQRPDEKHVSTVEEALEMIKRRTEGNKERYRKYYGFELMDKKNYDLVIDTTRMSVEEVVGKVLEAARKWQAEQ